MKRARCVIAIITEECTIEIETCKECASQVIDFVMEHEHPDEREMATDEMPGN